MTRRQHESVVRGPRRTQPCWTHLTGELRQLAEHAVDLGCELPCGGEDEHVGGGVPLVAMQQALENRQPEGGRLSRARHGTSANVSPGHGERDARGLDRGRVGIPEGMARLRGKAVAGRRAGDFLLNAI